MVSPCQCMQMNDGQHVNALNVFLGRVRTSPWLRRLDLLNVTPMFARVRCLNVCEVSVKLRGFTSCPGDFALPPTRGQRPPSKSLNVNAENVDNDSTSCLNLAMCDTNDQQSGSSMNESALSLTEPDFIPRLWREALRVYHHKFCAFTSIIFCAVLAVVFCYPLCPRHSHCTFLYHSQLHFFSDMGKCGDMRWWVATFIQSDCLWRLIDARAFPRCARHVEFNSKRNRSISRQNRAWKLYLFYSTWRLQRPLLKELEVCSYQQFLFVIEKEFLKTPKNWIKCVDFLYFHKILHLF